jgi:hypothetical protein
MVHIAMKVKRQLKKKGKCMTILQFGFFIIMEAEF